MHSIKKEYKNIFFHGRTHDPHPHNLSLTGLLSQKSPQACGVAGLIKNIFLYSFLLIPATGFASVTGDVNKANDLYAQGKFDDSLDLYQKALNQDDKSSVVKYDLGTALYKKGDYAQARGYLENVAHDKNIKIKTKAEYNLGNVLYKSGIQKENTNVDEAIKSLKEALGQYAQSVRDDPNDADAKFNQDFVKKEIERLKQKKQQQQKQNQQKKQQPQNQKQEEQNQQKQQQNQQSQQGNQDKQNQSQPPDQKKGQQSASQKEPEQSGSQDQDKKQQNTQARAEDNQKEIDRKAAQDLLEEYQENEEPKKLLNFNPKKIDDRPVLKDW